MNRRDLLKGKTLKEAIDKCNEYADQVIALGIEHTKISYDKAAKLVRDGKKFGIDM